MSVGLLGVVLLAWQGQRLGDEMPQAVHGDDVLSVAFGDAKETISRAMVHKADSYFHGGVDMECTEDHDHDCDGTGCTHEHHHHDEEHSDGSLQEHEHNEQAHGDLPDPWHWINRHIRAPEVERHLEGEKAVELMPWFWAAVKADPHNIDAWTTAFYMAYNTMHDDVLSRKVLDEAKRANPNSLEIRLSEGKFVYNRGKGDLADAERIFTSLRDSALARCNNNPEQLPENDRWMYKFALNYLADIAKKK